MQHLGEGRRAWAATIAAGPDATAKSAPQGDTAAPQEREALLAWPHEPAAVDYHVTEGRSWRNWLSDDGARAARLPAPATAEGSDAADASARGTASELVLAFYGRIPLDSLKLDGNRLLFDQLVDWDPER
ncbi:hypothetical protein ACFZB9_07890 [Kitasatospora sp. NPDC008050]|uniref:hypothetical protein n=1 Tax=Kitasatospora sp. NPDC008050 TaxID=3364021 RepID=UPI0036F0CFDD